MYRRCIAQASLTECLATLTAATGCVQAVRCASSTGKSSKRTRKSGVHRISGAVKHARDKMEQRAAAAVAAATPSPPPPPPSSSSSPQSPSGKFRFSSEMTNASTRRAANFQQTTATAVSGASAAAIGAATQRPTPTTTAAPQSRTVDVDEDEDLDMDPALKEVADDDSAPTSSAGGLANNAGHGSKNSAYGSGKVVTHRNADTTAAAVDFDLQEKATVQDEQEDEQEDGIVEELIKEDLEEDEHTAALDVLAAKAEVEDDDDTSIAGLPLGASTAAAGAVGGSATAQSANGNGGGTSPAAGRAGQNSNGANSGSGGDRSDVDGTGKGPHSNSGGSSMSTGVPAVGSLLDIESPINLRLATLFRHPGRPFRAITATFPTNRREMNFEVVFTDVASSSTLSCRLEDIPDRYPEWVKNFRASTVVLFVPTLSSPNTTLLEHTILHKCPMTFMGEFLSKTKQFAKGAAETRHEADPDHVLISYSKLREVIGKKRKDEAVNGKLLSVAVLNAYPEEWKQFISSSLSCSPQAIVTSSFNFSARDQSLNKQLLHAQLSVAANAKVALGKKAGRKQEEWSLVFVSAPMRSGVVEGAIPPLQNLLTGEFIDPMKLSDKSVIYIIGSGNAAAAFARFPLARKGRRAVSILLEDIESQLGFQKSRRSTLTMTLVSALDQFSRITWMWLMEDESMTARQPRPANEFFRISRRPVTRELLPSFLEPFFGPPPVSILGSFPHAGVPGNPEGNPEASVPRAGRRRLEEHIRSIFNNEERLARERKLGDDLLKSKCYFADVKSANITAARRADNPFSQRNGIVQFQGQMWSSMHLLNPPPTIELSAKDAGGVFIDAESCFPEEMLKSPGSKKVDPNAFTQGIFVAWDVKRVILFLRDSKKLMRFLHNGGRIWCVQYAQYLLKGFNHNNLANIERTLLHYHEGPLKAPMTPLEKVKLVFEKQIEIAVNSRQLQSIVHRMDGLLSTTEMELRGLQIVPESAVNAFSEGLKTTHNEIEKVLNDKIMAFTKSMDSEVRRKINFRSPQDISTIIYGGAMCRYLIHPYQPIAPSVPPAASIFPHAICQATGTPLPRDYSTMSSALLEGFDTGGENIDGPGVVQRRPSGVKKKIGVNIPSAKTVSAIEKLVKNANLDQIAANTAVVVLLARTKPGYLVEQISLYCPAYNAPNVSDDAADEGNAAAVAGAHGAGGSNARPGAALHQTSSTRRSGDDELNYRVAVDDILTMTTSSDLVTLHMLKDHIREFKPLKSLQPLKKHGRKSYEMRNVLILTNVINYEKTEALVDSGLVRTIAETVLGEKYDEGDEVNGIERVCLCDVGRCVPPPPQGAESFENDFSELSGVDSIGFSARATWEAYTKELLALGGYDAAIKALMSHCASTMASVRDPFRCSFPLPSSEVVGKHGQEAASTRGMLWIVTPKELYPLLHRSLRSRSVSSGADAMERVTSLLSPYENIDLSFFSALQQLRFTEKKMQLFDEGALFRAVLPECNDRVHGELCHSVTATGRLSSQSPNLQNIPKEEDLRRLIVSRFGPKNGRMIEADYSQLEVIVLAALSNDVKMIQEIKEKIDFHCLRVSLMTKEPYADVIKKTKVEKNPEYIRLRQQAKTFSFQRQYGAGISTIATTTGLTEKEVEKLISAEEHHYKDLAKFYRLVMDCVETGADRILRIRTLDSSEWTADIRRCVLLTEPMHYFVVHTGSKFDFSRDKKSLPKLKNYPVQGLAGEMVQIMCGRIIRKFYEKHNYNNRAFLVNTVHDCVWVDAHVDVKDEVMKDIEVILKQTSETMNSLWPEMKLDVPFNVDIHEGPSLGELSS